MTYEKKERVSISLYPSTLKLVSEEANKQNRSRSNLIEIILRQYFRIDRDEEKSTKPLARL